MRGTGFIAVMLAASAATLAPAAYAQCRLCSAPTTGAQQTDANDNVQLEIETDLDFDRLIVGNTTGGDATVRPDGSSFATGAIQVGPRTKVATVTVHGQPGRALRIDVPQRIQLFSLGGSSLTFDQVVTDAAEMPHLDSVGNLTFHIGGRLRFVGSEDGDYRGDLPVTVEYL
jgi:hypothetical protein